MAGFIIILSTMSKKIKFLKNHNGHKEGDSAELTPELANYLVRVKAAKEEKVAKETKELKVKRQTK